MQGLGGINETAEGIHVPKGTVESWGADSHLRTKTVLVLEISFHVLLTLNLSMANLLRALSLLLLPDSIYCFMPG